MSLSEKPHPTCSRRAGGRFAWLTPSSECECVRERVNVRRFCKKIALSGHWSETALFKTRCVDYGISMFQRSPSGWMSRRASPRGAAMTRRQTASCPRGPPDAASPSTRRRCSTTARRPRRKVAGQPRTAHVNIYIRGIRRTLLSKATYNQYICQTKDKTTI